MKTIDIVCPAYNEAEGILAFHQSLHDFCETLNSRYDFRFHYVVDKCDDDTFGLLKERVPQDDQLHVIQLSRRFGHQHSLIAGLDRCRGDATIMMDCDGQHPPAVIGPLLQQFEQGFDVVHTLREDAAESGAVKRWSSSLFYKVLDRLSETEIREGAADFRLISRKVLDVFQQDIREQNQFLRGLFSWVGFRQTTVTFRAENRSAGTSKYTVKRLVKFAFAGIHAFSKVPLTIATRVGMTIAGISFLVGILSLLDFLFHLGLPGTSGLPKGYTTLVLLITFSLGIQLVVLGVLGSYIGSILDEVKRRPLYIVEEEVGGESSH